MVCGNEGIFDYYFDINYDELTDIDTFIGAILARRFYNGEL